jgi:hypothetical protein
MRGHASEDSIVASKSVASRLARLIRPNVRSVTERLGNTMKPLICLSLRLTTMTETRLGPDWMKISHEAGSRFHETSTVLRKNAKVTPLHAVLRYRDLPLVEAPLPPNQGDHAHPTNLPFFRSRLLSATDIRSYIQMAIFKSAPEDVYV